MGSVNPQTGLTAVHHARQRRADMLRLLMVEAAREWQFWKPGMRLHCLEHVFMQAAHDPAILVTHVWLIEQAMFGSTKRVCLKHVRETIQWTGASETRAGSVSLSWLLDARTNGARLAAWLLFVFVDATDLYGNHLFSLSQPDPFASVRNLTLAESE